MSIEGQPWAIFQPTAIGRRSGAALVYYDLSPSSTTLIYAEKDWLIQGLTKRLNDNIFWTILNINSYSDVEKQYGIKKSCLCDWKRRLESGQTLNEVKGRPAGLSHLFLFSCVYSLFICRLYGSNMLAQ
jgi:hypothetical protein